METILSYNEFKKNVIAQDDDDDPFGESGYLVVKKDEIYSFFKYSHCSCYDTWEDITQKSVLFKEDKKEPWNSLYTFSPLWVGNREELSKMVQDRIDPNIPDRKSEPEDFDYDHLMKVYDQLEVYLSKEQ